MPEPRTPTPGSLGGSQVLMATLEPYFTSVGAPAVIEQCTFTNITNGTVRVMALHVVPADTEPSDATVLLTRVQLEPFETYSCDEVIGHILNTGDRVMAQAEQAGTIILRMSGRVGV